MICIFCGQPGDPSKEHIWPRWLREGLGATGKMTTIHSEFGVFKRSWSTTGLTWILPRRICVTCNTTWMSRLEDDLKDWLLPAVLGQPIEWSLGLQKAIATWAVLKAQCFALKQLPLGAALGGARQSNLTWLYDHRAAPEPPPGSQVWIARIDPFATNRTPQAGSHTVTGSPDIDGYMVTIAIGELIFQVVGQDFRQPDNLTPGGLPLVAVERPDWLLSYLRALWPERPDIIRWPLSYRIKGSDWRRLADWEGTAYARVLRVDIPRLG